MAIRLEKIATEAGAPITWQLLALFNWGTQVPSEVTRALCETIGVELVELRKPEFSSHPEKLPLKPNNDLRKEILVPKPLKVDAVDVDKTLTLTVKALTPANAVSIHKLDKWFLPETENCDIGYALQGLARTADKVHLNIYGSNYCDATGWVNGLPVFGAPGAMLKKPLFTKTDLAADEPSRTAAMPGAASAASPKGRWRRSRRGRPSGMSTWRSRLTPCTFGTTRRRSESMLRNWCLLPFWPTWETDEARPAVTPPNWAANAVIFKWTNAADQGQRRHRSQRCQRTAGVAEEAGRRPAEGRRPVRSHGTRPTSTARRTASSSRAFLTIRARWSSTDATAGGTRRDHGLLFVSAPYTVLVVTEKRKRKAASFNVDWKLLHTGDRLKRGLIRIVDHKGRTVFLRGMSPSMLSQNAPDAANDHHRFHWNGKYERGIKVRRP